MKLVVTPKPHPTESVMGYALRLTEANGYPTVAYVLSALSGDWYRSTYGRLDAAALSDLAGLALEDTTRLTMRPDDMPRAYIRVMGNDLPAYEVALRYPKVCPKCLSEGAACEAFWDLTQAVACPRHCLKLVGQCPVCLERLTWSRSKIAECGCGADLRSADSESVSDELCDVMGALRYFVYNDASIARLPGSMMHLSHMTLRSVCKMLWVMTSARYELKREPSDKWLPRSRTRFLGNLERVSRALSDWPRGFQDFLCERYHPTLEQSAEQPNFRTLFSWLFVRLTKNDPDGGICYAFMEEQAFRFGAKFWTRGGLTRGGGRREGRLPSDLDFRWGTLSEVVEITGLHPVTLNGMIQRGDIPAKALRRRSVRRVLVDLQWVRSQKTSAFSTVSLREAAKLTGLSIQTLVAMRNIGVYEATHRCAHHAGWAREDVELLSARLRALSYGKSEVERGVVTADECFLINKATGAEKAFFFGRLLENPSLAMGYQGDSFTPGCLQVAVCDAVQIMADQRGMPMYVTAQVAAKRLRCSADVITGLKRAGHLALGIHHGREAICQVSLAAFEQNYETLTAIAKRTGVCIKRAYHRLDIKVVKHLRVPGVQHTTTFINRDDVAKIESMLTELG